MKNFRFYAFWTLDFLKGSPVRKHFKEIELINNRDKRAGEIQDGLMSDILQYAVTHTEYYKNLNPESIYNFPVVNKEEVVSNMDEMFSVDYKDKKDKLKSMSTSGTTGSPFKIYQNANKVNRNTADVLYFYNKGGYSIGDRIYHLRVWTDLNRKSRIDVCRENYKMLDTSNLDKEGATNFIKSLLSDKSKKLVLGFPSSFDALMEYIDEDAKYDWNVKAIFALAEALPNKTKRKMQAIFKCPVLSIYSNQELGFLARQPYTGENYFEINTASYFIEFLKIDSDEPAEEMEEARIVVTDLFNKAVPMIRYDTGDLGAYSYIKDKNGQRKRVINKVIGRKADYLYSNQKQRLSPYIIITKLWDYYGIKQCQLIQEDYDEVTLKVVYRENENKAAINSQLTKEVMEVFGKDTNLQILDLNDIPVEKSGKRKYIVSKIDREVKNAISI